MNPWTEAEFQRVAIRTRLSDRTLAACKEVLVDGISGIDAAAKHKTFPAQISRAIGVLREKQAGMLESAQALQSGEELLKLTAAQVAKNILGHDLFVKDAVPGQTYEGPVIVNTHGFAVQKVGRSGVLHDLGKLLNAPPINVSLSIAYPARGGKAVVTEKSQSKAQGKEAGR